MTVQRLTLVVLDAHFRMQHMSPESSPAYILLCNCACGINKKISVILMLSSSRKSVKTYNSNDFQVFLVRPLSHYKLFHGVVCNVGSKLVLLFI